MTALKSYIENKNALSALFGRTTSISYPPTGDDVTNLFDSLEGALSPENLTCDGELRGAALNRKARDLNAAYSELCNYGSPPDYGY